MSARACPQCGAPVEPRRADYCAACDQYSAHVLASNWPAAGEPTALYNARFLLTVIEAAIKGERTLEPSGPALEAMRINVVALITHVSREAGA